MSKQYNLLPSLLPALRFPDYLTDSYEWQGHIPFAFWLIHAHRPRQLVELGTYRGDSYLSFCQAVACEDIECQCHAIDTWEGDSHVGHYGPEVYDSLRQYHDSRYSSFSKLHKMKFEEALPTFEDGTIDLLHIDGMHDYRAVADDFGNWLPKLSTRGIVALHDTAVKDREFGVWRFLRELRDTGFPVFEFYHSNGLALVFVGNDVSEDIRTLSSLDQSDAKYVRELFQALGDRVHAHVQIMYWMDKTKSLNVDYGVIKRENEWLRDRLSWGNGRLRRLARKIFRSEVSND